MLRTCAVIPAAGRGVRMGKGKPKQFLELAGRPILIHTLEVLARTGFLSEILVVVSRDYVKATDEMVRGYSFLFHQDVQRSKVPDETASPTGLPNGSACGRRGKTPSRPAEDCRIFVVEGGVERQDSVSNALKHLPADCRYVLIHDGVRPFVSDRLLVETWHAALKSGAAIAAVPATDTVKRVDEQTVLETLPREDIWLVQTPQVFQKELILDAYRKAGQNGWSGTDDSAFVERMGHRVSVVVGERTNIKVTTLEDLIWARWYLGERRSAVGGQVPGDEKV